MRRTFYQWGISPICVLTFVACGRDPSFKTIAAEENLSGTTTADGSNPNGFPDEIIRQFGELPPGLQKDCLDAGMSESECLSLSAFSYDTVQPDLGGKMDILFVVDSSGSMAEEQASLGANFGSFMNELGNLGIDFRVAVTSTDVCQSQKPSNLSEIRCPVRGASSYLQGGFVGNSSNKILTTNTPNVETKFEQNTNIGISGSGFEHGLTAARLGIEKSLNNQNPSLLRNDAFLSVIVVSDEEDDGIGLGMADSFNHVNYVAQGLTTFRYTDDDFISYLHTIKGEGQFSVSAITGVIDQATGRLCQSPNGNPAEEGTQYIKAAQKTGGSIQSICASQWDNLLASLGGDFGAQISQIVLEQHALPQSIQVRVDGTLSTYWTYVEASNSVKFSADHLPSPGSNIEIKYLGIKK